MQFVNFSINEYCSYTVHSYAAEFVLISKEVKRKTIPDVEHKNGAHHLYHLGFEPVGR